MPLADRAREASILASRIVTGDAVLREASLQRLRTLYPDWVFGWSQGLCIRVPLRANIPRALAHCASYIEQEQASGEVIVVKDRDGSLDAPARRIGRPPRTWYERILKDD